MNTADSVRTAEAAHQLLRRRKPGSPPDEDSAMSFRTLNAALERVAKGTRDSRHREVITKIFARLTSDAEFYAGRNPHAEPIQNEADILQGYRFLEQAASGPPSSP